MTIARRNLAEAVDYSSITGTTASDVAFPNSTAATNSLGALYGVGFADRGYGQTSVTLPTITQGDLIPSQAWTSLHTALNVCANFTNVDIGTVPEVSNFAVGEVITNLKYDWNTAVVLIDQSRLTIPSDRFATPVSVITSTRTTDWPDQIKLVFEARFSSEDKARYFFNSGGKIKITPSFVPNTNTAHYNSWRTLLQGVTPTSTNFAGSIELGAHSCDRHTGTGGTFQNVGYYELSTTSTQLLQFRVADLDSSLVNATGIYKDFASNYYSINSYVKNKSAVNGSNGSTVVVEVIFSDVYGSSAQPVKGTASVNVEMIKANSAHLLIESPVFTTVTNLSNGGGDIYQNFVDVVDANMLNYNLYSRANAKIGYTGTIPLRATIRILNNVIIGSTNISDPALLIPTLPSNSAVILYNQGFILGKGGVGGAGTALVPGGAGTDGGTAMLIYHPIILQNTGVIGGGGGGGGGSTSNNATLGADDPGGSGGGGAGFNVGTAGNVGPTPLYYGQPGGWLLGGAGGTLQAHGGSAEWWQAAVGGKGGDLGQAGATGTGMFGGGAGGSSGTALIGKSNLVTGSLIGDVRGAQV